MFPRAIVRRLACLPKPSFYCKCSYVNAMRYAAAASSSSTSAAAGAAAAANVMSSANCKPLHYGQQGECQEPSQQQLEQKGQQRSKNVNASTKLHDTITRETNNEVPEIPNLNFLSRPENLPETVDGTIEACTGLLNAIAEAKTPQEKHDLIDTTSNVLCLLLDPCEFVRQIHPDERYRMSADMAFQKGFEFMSTVNSRRDLYDVVKELDSPAGHKGLDAESIKNVIQLRRDMENNGIHLPDKEREKVVELNIENETLGMRLLEARQTANPYSTLTYLLRCRYELAQLLGFESFAQKQLQGKMLNTQEQVWHFLCSIFHKYRAAAEKEVELIKSNIGEVNNRAETTDQLRAYVANSLVNNAMPEEINQYFSVANCIRGIQCLCSETFGVKLEPVPFNPEEVFSPQAKKFHAYNDRKEFLGVILLDLYANPAKHCTSGHLTLQLGCIPHQQALAKINLKLPKRQYPVVALTCNVGASKKITCNVDGTPNDELTTMDWNEVTTLFHEFGHAMHTIFGQTHVQNLAGTRSSVDYVETFSQLFEQFLTSHEFLKLWAHKMSTKIPISLDLVQRRNAAAEMFKHLDMLDQVLLSAVDQTLHGPQPLTVYFPNGEDGSLGRRTLGDLTDYGRGMFNLSKALIDIATPLSIVQPTEMGVMKSLSLEHMSSYPADYYGYLYSLRVARRIWTKKFAANPLNRTAGKELVDKVMRHGAACDPRTTIESYLNENLDNTDIWV